MIHLSQVTKLRAGSTVLREANMLLPKGSYTILQVDSEFSGSALLRLLTGFDRPDRGKVRVNDIDVTNLSPDRVPFLRRNIGLLEFNPTLAGNRTVAENIAMPLQIAGFDRKAMLERISNKIAQTGLEDSANTLVRKLKPARQRLVACARATVHNPQTVLADGPGQGLNEETAEVVFAMLEKANQHGATVLVLTSANIPARRFTHTMQLHKGSVRDSAFTTRLVT